MKYAIILFSGGIDSSYLTYKIANKYDKIILLTYKTPGMINVSFSKRSSKILINLFPNKIEHKILNIENYVKKIRGGFLKSILSNLKYKTMYSWCLGCKLAMHLYTIEFCKKNKFNLVLDGSNKYDKHALEQHKYIKDIFEKIYIENGIKYSSPFYEDKNIKLRKGLFAKFLRHITFLKEGTINKKEFLEKKGFYFGKGIGSQFRRTQPSCKISLIFNVPRAIISFLINYKNKKKQIEYILNTIPNHFLIKKK